MNRYSLSEHILTHFYLHCADCLCTTVQGHRNHVKIRFIFKSNILKTLQKDMRFLLLTFLHKPSKLSNPLSKIIRPIKEVKFGKSYWGGGGGGV
jgi:hypothetical protein